MKNISNRKFALFITIIIVAIMIITIVVAPSNNKLNSGSTYSRSPDGYGAWYTYMKERGTSLERWQKPFESLSDKDDITLLQINPNNISINSLYFMEDWIKKGNNLIILGVKESVTKAKFTTFKDSQFGQIKIETSRRNEEDVNKTLGDEFGAIIWQENIGKGKIIAVVTPHLGANAYQDSPGNYEFLAQLVTQSGYPIYVDEYLHGYKDKEDIKEEVGENIFSYLSNTPLLPIFVQSLVIILLLIWSNNHRLGKAITLDKPNLNNSLAYVKALSGVLQKAESSDFVISTINQEEQKQLQKALGLNDKSLNSEGLIKAWEQQTGKSVQGLRGILNLTNKKGKMNDVSLRKWLAKWQEIRSKINN
ncbi:DUF4350 domain-containing protein [Crocosphaera sp. XPORK-15E]|uniref:DUF4350 domain-containing protein n=1 Tax=Crocosphaera sp. XPORK-15E TaxID=3110247 RepID=UPI002B1E9222|nr:DUF4350 domain-containing protein [Crocosphaera sp. XPORK-15E]MEA5535164.1 DUF4350 domain-containing protein [Crocosphaera sp. XPORK-15E]